MENITLEKIDIIRERTGVNYAEAKDALEICEGNVVDALVYLEEKIKNESKEKINEFVTTKEDFKKWINDLIQKGNVTRIKIKKGDRVVVDVPVNAGIAAGMVSMIFPPVLGIGVLAAIATKVTIEITKEDGTVEVVNAVIKNVVDDTMDKVNKLKKDVKEKFNENDKNYNEEGKSYSYTVNFNEEKVEPMENQNSCSQEEKCCNHDEKCHEDSCSCEDNKEDK
ncbi:DUF4342 domain-containing protein [Hathewaya massiliensis]|uniref:DUF4342 domain-containing protein n=1 Tax=Hathewaya massiliensis TaxID=1964382 RepID=UPI00115B9B2A|nr:DUF4342 domain-containing protein [Hathewaya massiliensis]